MLHNRLFFIMLLSVVITGCSTVKTTELKIDKKEVIKITIPDTLLLGHKPNKFMSEEEYLNLLYPDKEKELSDYIVELYGVIRNLNDDIDSIKKLNEDFKK